MVLQTIREKLTGILAGVFFAVLIIPFAFVGVNSYFTSDAVNSVAVVNEHVFVVPETCFGCGNCRNVCPHGAVEWHDRMDYPSLVDMW